MNEILILVWLCFFQNDSGNHALLYDASSQEMVCSKTMNQFYVQMSILKGLAMISWFQISLFFADIFVYHLETPSYV